MLIAHVIFLSLTTPGRKPPLRRACRWQPHRTCVARAAHRLVVGALVHSRRRRHGRAAISVEAEDALVDLAQRRLGRRAEAEELRAQPGCLVAIQKPGVEGQGAAPQPSCSAPESVTDRSSRTQPVARGAVRTEKRTVSDCASSLSFRPELRLEADAATQAASSSTAVKVCIPPLSLRAQ